MPILDTIRKRLQLKVVYYGPDQGGKADNLTALHRILSERRPNGPVDKLVSLASSGDRTYTFETDYRRRALPGEDKLSREYSCRWLLLTVPPQSIYDTTQLLLLRGADGIVFAAEARRDKMAANAEVFRRLAAQLQRVNLSLERVPLVLQCNDPDDGLAVSPEDFRTELLKICPAIGPGVPVIRACPLRGEGVLETLDCVQDLAVQNFLSHRPTGLT